MANLTAGWYPDPQHPGQFRWWNGSAWTEPRLSESDVTGAGSVSPTERTAALNRAVAGYAKDGWTVDNITGDQAILSRPKRIGWFWNLLLTIVTGGLWLIVVIIRVVNRKIETKVLRVDASGRVS